MSKTINNALKNAVINFNARKKEKQLLSDLVYVINGVKSASMRGTLIEYISEK